MLIEYVDKSKDGRLFKLIDLLTSIKVRSVEDMGNEPKTVKETTQDLCVIVQKTYDAKTEKLIKVALYMNPNIKVDSDISIISDDKDFNSFLASCNKPYQDHNKYGLRGNRYLADSIARSEGLYMKLCNECNGKMSKKVKSKDKTKKHRGKMTIKEYQQATQKTAAYPQAKALEYLILGLASEAGEAAGVLKKHIRDNTDDDVFGDKLHAELGDVLWYVSQICNEMGMNMELVMEANIKKLKSRKERGKIQGSGDDR